MQAPFRSVISSFAWSRYFPARRPLSITHELECGHAETRRASAGWARRLRCQECRPVACVVLAKEQGTDEWKAARHGRITASATRYALAKDGTKGRTNYIQQLADDLDGIPDFADQEPAPWFTDGIYYEAWARGWYAWQRHTDVGQTGFVVHGKYSWIGCSPDGLLGDDGLLEIKYRKSLKTFHQHAALFANASVIAQIQTQLYVTGRRWCDYLNYWRSDDHEKEKGKIERIERDDAYIDNTLLPAFVGLWGQVQALLEERRRRYNPNRAR